MLSHQLSFSSSWKMLTRDKGWIKPLLVLTLVGCIPILGQIAILGFGLEWARLTAWGVDSAPKQGGVKYGKILRTGGIAFLVAMSMAAVVAFVEIVLCGSATAISILPGTTSLLATDVATDANIVNSLVAIAVNLFLGTFIAAAMMRSTLYDSFTAGWRLDRLCQMIACDVKGFFKTYLVSLIAGFVNWLYSAIISFLAITVFLGGFVAFLGASYVMPLADESVDLTEGIANMLLQTSPALVLGVVIIFILLAFVGGVVSTAMQLVSTNAVGQWFCRFDVARWGVSSAPLPDGVPIAFSDEDKAQPAEPAGSAPVAPEGAEQAIDGSECAAKEAVEDPAETPSETSGEDSGAEVHALPPIGGSAEEPVNPEKPEDPEE